MTGRNFGTSIMMMGCALFLSGGMALAEDLPPLPPVPAEYADKHMPAGGWTDPKAIEDGALIFSGEANPQVDCGSCHGKDGKPVKKGARDMRDPNNLSLVRRFLVLADTGRCPEDEDEVLEEYAVRRTDLACDGV